MNSGCSLKGMQHTLPFGKRRHGPDVPKNRSVSQIRGWNSISRNENKIARIFEDPENETNEVK